MDCENTPVLFFEKRVFEGLRERDKGVNEVSGQSQVLFESLSGENEYLTDRFVVNHLVIRINYLTFAKVLKRVIMDYSGYFIDYATKILGLDCADHGAT